jgi:predicted MFS family arabinose efflux permease
MLDLFTVLVVSLFLGLELVLLVIRIIESRIFAYKRQSEPDQSSEALREQSNRTPEHCVNFVRQISFLFYFASCLASAFIPVLASQLAASAFTGSGGVAAGIPHSVESLFTCVSIFLTSELIIKFGWKQPFLFGLVFVMGGTLLSAFTDSIIVFAATRAIVGLGYGFCWMTLRNISLFGVSEKERSWAFAMFLAGLYAGQNCGQVMGSILAETLGYKMVLIIAALATGLSGILVLSLKNDRLEVAGAADEKETLVKSIGAKREIVQMVIFMALFMVPVCISGSFASYFLPVYVTSTGGSIADVGRVLLLYSLVIVYGGPKITEICQKYLGKKSYPNFWYNVILAFSFLFFGISGGFGAIAISIVIIGLADGFGTGAQKDSFLSTRLISRMPQSKGLSWYSFLMKLAAMLGPIVFALSLGAGNRGVLFIGILFLASALLAVLCLRRIERTSKGD